MAKPSFALNGNIDFEKIRKDIIGKLERSD